MKLSFQLKRGLMEAKTSAVIAKAEEIVIMAISQTLGVPEDLDGPEWDRYFGCLELQIHENGACLSGARKHCKQYRPDLAAANNEEEN